MSHPVNWFQISGGDAKALTEFYAKVFAWKMAPAPGPGGLMLVEAAKPDGIAGGIGASPDGKPGVVVYVGVEDIDAHLAKIGKAGGKTAMPRMELPDGWGSIALFCDPAGNVTGLWQAPKKLPKARRAKGAEVSTGETRAKPEAPAAAEGKKSKKQKKGGKKAGKKDEKKNAKKAGKKEGKKGGKKKKG